MLRATFIGTCSWRRRRPPQYTTLSIISRKVVNAFLSLRDRDREYQLMLDWLGFTQATVAVRACSSASTAASAYTMRRLLTVAFDGMYFRTTVLLRLIVILGFAISLAGRRLRGVRDLRPYRRGLAARLYEHRRPAAAFSAASSSSALAS